MSEQFDVLIMVETTELRRVVVNHDDLGSPPHPTAADVAAAIKKHVGAWVADGRTELIATGRTPAEVVSWETDAGVATRARTRWVELITAAEVSDTDRPGHA